MKREVSLNEISDGRLYGLNDMVRADCQDCKGCSSCCSGMGNSIILDPLDLYRLVANLGIPFDGLLADKIELKVVDGIILPNLKMAGASEQCVFLNEEGRCSIHGFRPGICRLFPLGRYYENHGFQYFLQVHECEKENKTKVKVRRWIDTPDLKSYETFITDWHYFLNDLQDIVNNAQDEAVIKDINLYVLNNFYRKAYDMHSDFYGQFNELLHASQEIYGSRALQSVQPVTE